MTSVKDTNEVYPAQQLATLVKVYLPDVVTKIDRPLLPHGIWWVDIQRGDKHLTAVHSNERGYGLYVTKSETGHFGEGPEEIFVEQRPILNRIIELLSSSNGQDG